MNELYQWLSTSYTPRIVIFILVALAWAYNYHIQKQYDKQEKERQKRILDKQYKFNKTIENQDDLLSLMEQRENYFKNIGTCQTCGHATHKNKCVNEFCKTNK